VLEVSSGQTGIPVLGSSIDIRDIVRLIVPAPFDKVLEPPVLRHPVNAESQFASLSIQIVVPAAQSAKFEQQPAAVVSGKSQ